jgi:hypothetical protein
LPEENVMHKTLRSFVAFSLLLSFTCYMPSLASAQQEKSKADKVKAAVAKLGTGFDARVKVKLIDETKLKGYVSEAKEDYFVVVDDETSIATKVAYTQVKQVKGRSRLNGGKIISGLLVTALLLYGLLFDGNF